VAWERRFYRGNKAWILVDEAGKATLDERGHAQLRYKPEDDRTYTVRPEEVRLLEAGPEDPEPGEPTRTKPPIEAWIHVGGPGPDGRLGIGILLVWRERRREISRRLPAASEDEVVVGAVLEGLGAIRRPAWPVRVRCAAATRLEAIHAGAGTVPPACGEALRSAAEAFADLQFLPPPVPASPDAERAARLAQSAAPH
jgi:hypothetical protein